MDEARERRSAQELAERTDIERQQMGPAKHTGQEYPNQARDADLLEQIWLRFEKAATPTALELWGAWACLDLFVSGERLPEDHKAEYIEALRQAVILVGWGRS